jgi:hypothetical protein
LEERRWGEGKGELKDNERQAVVESKWKGAKDSEMRHSNKLDDLSIFCLKFDRNFSHYEELVSLYDIVL